MMMRYEHIVQINDPLDNRIEPLSRGQLWQGLVVRAERPAYFLIGLDECRIVARTANTLERQLQFGALQVSDRVTFEPALQVHFQIKPSGDVAGASLVIRIEEPQPEQLFLRFEYELQVAADSTSGELDEYRKSAYREADIDTVRMIRQLAASGVLSPGGPVADLH
jgi:hypothetical protein